MQKFALSILGQDRPGIVARVAEILADSGCNIEDLSQTILQSRLQKVETRKLQLAGTGERLIISDSYNCHNARSPVPARKNILFAGDSLQGEFAAIYIFSKPDQVLPEDLIHSLKQALNPWGLKNLFAWVDLFLRQYRVWLIKKKMGSELPIFLTSFLKNY